MERLEQYGFSAELAKMLRADGGKTLGETADLAGVSKSTWQTYEQQKRLLEVEIIERFCNNAGLKPAKYVKAFQSGCKAMEKTIKPGKAMDKATKLDKAPEANDLKLYRKALGWTLEEATEYLGISKRPLVRVEGGSDEGERMDRTRVDTTRAQYHGIFVRAAQQARALVDQYRSGNSDFIADIDGLCIVPIFETTTTLHSFFPQLRGTGQTAAYFRYVAWLAFFQLLELGKAVRLYEFSDIYLKNEAFRKEVSAQSLKAFLKSIRWA